MVSEQATGEEVMSACSDFTQNAWKKDLCVNCQRPKGEHSETLGNKSSTVIAADSPKPAKRNSLMTKSWTSAKDEDLTEEDKWSSMCLPDPDQTNNKIPENRNKITRAEPCYEDIDGETLKVGQESSKSGESKSNGNNNSAAEKRSSAVISDKMGLRDSKSRSRSSSRDKSPAPALKPKPAEKRVSISDKTKVSESDTKTSRPPESQRNDSSKLSPRSRKKLKKGHRSISFQENDPVVIGDDGGIDNLYSDNEDDVLKPDANEETEILKFTEDEKEWALQALKNTIWNTEHVSVEEESDKKNAQSKTYEDAQMESLWKPDRFANVRDCDPAPESQNFGTFPLRTKSEKSAIDNMFSANRLSTLSESVENTAEGSDVENKYDSVMKFLSAGNVDFSLSPKHKSATKNVDADDGDDQNYDDPWEDKFAFDADSEMNLLDEIRGEIDLDSSAAGLELVDLLNNVLAKYSTPSECGESVKNLDLFEDDKIGETKDGKTEKTAELEAKMVTLAASLRKQRAKGRAPRPPSCPPEPPQDGATKSPAKQMELRAAQSREPTFKMVPIGKPIGSGMSQSTPSPVIQNPLTDHQPVAMIQKSETLPAAVSDSSENLKSKNEKQKKSGGFGSFFSRFLRRGRDSETDLTTSSETLVSNGGSISEAGNEENQSDKGSCSSGELKKSDHHVKPEKRGSKSSPQLKMKVLPVRPVSPKPTDKPSVKEVSKDVEKEAKGSNSPVTEKQTKATVVSESSSPSPPGGKGKDSGGTPKVQLSPTKSLDKEQLAASPKTKEAPPLPLHPPREPSDPALVPPKPRARGNSDSGQPRSRPRARDSADGKPRDIPNVPPPKPPVAAKPRPTAPPPKISDTFDSSGKSQGTQKEIVASTKSLDEDGMVRGGRVVRDSQRKTDPNVLRKRAKSPKRFAAPTAPVRSSMPNIHGDTAPSVTASEPNLSTQSESKAAEPKGISFAKELEAKLNKEQGSHPEVRRPPPPPPTGPIKADSIEKAKSHSLPKDSSSSKTITKDKDLSKSFGKDADRSKSSSRDDLKISPPQDDQHKMVTSLTELDQPPDIPFQPEKIELPKPAGNSRKSFLGKLNRKNKPAPPPSVKRTKSITESSLQAEHHLKKIDLKDISGPVLITEMSSNKAVSRRNTISIGDDNPFLSGGSTSSGSTSAGEKSDLSPRGSVENLYEFITSEAPQPPVGADKKNFYDPVVEKTIALRPPSISGIEGYLEPVRSNTGQAIGEPVKSNMAESTTSVTSMTSSMVAMVNNLTQSVTEDMTVSAGLARSTENQDLDELKNISDERRELLASQPIYEEINGYGRLEGAAAPIVQDVNDGELEEEQVYGVGGDIPSGNLESFPNQPISSGTNLKSHDSFSSESDLSSANNSLSRPRPIPRKRPRQVGSGFEQYVAMNRPSVAVFLNEEQLREMLSKLTAMNLQTLREIYTQHEKCFTKENLQIGAVGPLKWHDFNIYGKPLHTSEKCVVYNAKLKSSTSPCQLMLLHSRPEITAANHPSLLKPTCIFTDSVPFSYLTEDFIRTSQILETCVNQANANLAKCYVVVGLFDITESLTNHLNSLQTVCENQKDFLRKILFFILQLLSAISHCLEQGHPLAETDFHDLYLISNPYCLGETVSFLPQVRAPEDQQIDSVCLFLERFLEDMCNKCEASSVLDDAAFFTYTGIQKVVDMLRSGAVECLPIVRSYTEFLLWGPEETDPEFKDHRHSNIEPKLSMWLEKQRSDLIHDFAKRVQRGARCNIRDFYKMKFLLKASSGSLAECIRCHTAASDA